MTNPLVTIIESDVKEILSTVSLNKLEKKSLLLTGASGLLGTYFIACLRQYICENNASISLTAIVHSTPEIPFNLFLNFQSLKIIKGDITSNDLLNSLGKFDYIIHAAGYGQPGRFMEDEIKTIKINSSVTMQLFDHLNEDGHFLFLSTSEVYSGLDQPPFKESQIGNTNTTHTRSCYIESKRCGEAICNIYRSRGMHASSARLALAYGPGTKISDRRVINSFIQRGIIQKKIDLQDMGEAKRTYCYISDAIEVLWNILLNGTNSIYNVGGVSKTTIADLARSIGKYLDVPVTFPVGSVELKGAPDDVCLDLSLTNSEFKKFKYVGLNEGLEKTIEWQKSLYVQST